MTLAVNRPCTRAFGAILHLSASRLRSGDVVDERLQPLLERVLHLEGSTGLQYRAMLVGWVGVIRAILPIWSEHFETALFDPESALGVETLALEIKWARPDDRILETYRSGVSQLVKSGRDRALDYLL